MSAESDKDLWAQIKARAHRAIENEEDNILWQFAQYFDHCYNEAVVKARENDPRRGHHVTSDRQRECREIQEEHLDRLFSEKG